jgi:LysM repeat protein
MYYYYRKQCPPGTFLYTIKIGDNFYRLAIRFNTTVAAIISANPGVNPNNLLIGEIICVPRQKIYTACTEANYYTIKPRDTLYGIANRFNVSLDDLFEANPGIMPYMFMIGQVICIPKGADDLSQTKEIPVFAEGKIEYLQARLHRSEQGYYIYVLDNYKFTAEEPGSDVIFSTIDDNFFVRIQRLPLDANINVLKQNAIFSLRDIGEPRELTGEEISDPFFRTNKFFFNASNKATSVNRILKEIGGSLFLFTMFLPDTEARSEIMFSFYAMLKTTGVI